jgi:hypothetical protein
MPQTPLEVFVTPSRENTGKFWAVARAFPAAWEGPVLDVGCRGSGLKKALREYPARYVGLDLLPPSDVIADLGAGLPFRDGSFRSVVALDVLEHTDDIYGAFRELARVAGEYLVVSLPNSYDIKLRLGYLRGRSHSDKYGLPLEPVEDRHRWFFSFSEAQRFCSYWSEKLGFPIVSQGLLLGGRRSALWRLARRFPDLLSTTYVALMRRASDQPGQAAG